MGKMKSMEELFRLVILQNELSGNEKAALKFSDPDGASGRSGWSFGLCQFDTRHNNSAVNCLEDCGFTAAEIRRIVNQTADVKPLNSRLVRNAEIVARYDTAQLALCLHSAMNVITSKGVIVVNTAPILALADYVNQYGSIGNQFAAWLNTQGIDGPITIQEIQEWKLNHTKYGREHPADCRRRYKNILTVLEREGVEI